MPRSSPTREATRYYQFTSPPTVLNTRLRQHLFTCTTTWWQPSTKVTSELSCCQQRFNVCDAALDWFTSYYADRTQVVVVGTDASFVSELWIGAPQGSVLGPKFFVAYAEDFTNIFEQHRVRNYLFADDMQGVKHSKPSNVRDVTACWAWSLCDVCEQLVRVEAPSTEHQENRGDVVWVCKIPHENLVCRQRHSLRIRHYITIFCCL